MSSQVSRITYFSWIRLGPSGDVAACQQVSVWSWVTDQQGLDGDGDMTTGKEDRGALLFACVEWGR